MMPVAPAPTRSGAASALLDPEASRARTSELRAWTASQKAVVRERFAALRRAWCAEWLPRGRWSHDDADIAVYEARSWSAGAALAAANAAEKDVVLWDFAQARGGALERSPGAAPATGPDYDRAPSDDDGVVAIERALFGEEDTSSHGLLAGGTMASAVARAAWADWLERLRQGLGGASIARRSLTATPAACDAPDWSGCLRLEAPGCGGTWQLHLPPSAVRALLKGAALPSRTGVAGVVPAAPLKRSLAQALSSRTLSVRVLLADAELSLGQLGDLRVGDVIPLTHPLETPAEVVVADGARLCGAWLGRRAQRVAVELAVPERGHAASPLPSVSPNP